MTDLPHEHDLGLQQDVRTLQRHGLGRRGLLGMAGGLGAVALVGCADQNNGAGSPTDGSPTGGGTGPVDQGGGMAGASDVEVAAGESPRRPPGRTSATGRTGRTCSPSPASSGRTSPAASARRPESPTAYPLTLRFRVYDLSGNDVAPLAGAALYAWHCDRDGSYSMYDGDVVDENYLRGVREADSEGWLSFTTIFPGCYAGRWPHVHFEVYESVATATTASNVLRTSQLAFPAEVCETVYAADGYDESATNLAQVSLDGDGIFGDGYWLQLATITGSVDEGLVATLKVPI